MNIRTKLRLVSLVTLIGLGLVGTVSVWGLNAIQETQETAHRRDARAQDMLEIKASALSTIMLDPSLPETREIFDTASKSVTRYGSTSLGAVRRPEVREELKSLLARWDRYVDESQKLIKLAATDSRSANEKVAALYNGSFKALQADLEKFVDRRKEEALKGMTDARALSNRVFWAVVGLIAASTVVIVGALLNVSISLQSSLRGIVRQLAPLKEGDLTQRLPNRHRDELDEIAGSVNDFVAELQQIVRKTRERSDHLAGAAVQLASASAGVLQGSGQQSDAASAVAASVEEFSVSIDQVSDNAGQAEQKATRSGELSRSGGQGVGDAIAEIGRIEQAVGEAAGRMQTLDQQARDISSIVNVIKEVADQTNLLALNAAIEAARAGEQGRGFAVVADEVRKLAERTTSSAQEITAMVMSVQQSTEQATVAMQEGNELVAQSARRIEEAGNSMQQIGESSAGVVQSVGEISTALREQRIAGAEIARNVESIAQMAQAGREAASEVSSAAQQLERLAQELQEEVVRFTV